MELTDYLTASGRTFRDMAREVGCSEGTVRRAARRLPTKLETALGISHASRGLVGLLDLVPDDAAELCPRARIMARSPAAARQA